MCVSVRCVCACARVYVTNVIQRMPETRCVSYPARYPLLSRCSRACEGVAAAEQTSEMSRATAVVAGDCNAPGPIRPLTNHSVRGI